MTHTGLIRKNAAKILKSILPQCTAVAGIFCLFSLVGGFFGQLLAFLLPSAARTMAILCVSALFHIFLVTPLHLGIARWTWRLTGGADDSLRTVFRYFGDGENYRRALGFSLRLNLRLYAVQLLQLPALLSTQLDTLWPEGSTAWLDRIDAGAVSALLSPVLSVIQVGGVILYIWLTLRYFLAPYLLVNDEGLAPADALRLSFRIMRRRAGGLLGFFCGFIGWGLLCILVLPIMYVLPLLWLSSAIYGRYLIASYNQDRLSGAFYGGGI